MSDSTLRVLLTIVLMFHGIGHGLGILSVVGVKLSKAHSPDSVILGKFMGDAAVKIFGMCLWSIVIACFIAAGAGLLGLGMFKAHWQAMALFGSVLSLFGLFLFWNAFPFLFPHKIGAIAIDIGTIVCIGWLKWPVGIVT